MKAPALLQGEIITKYWKYIDEIKNLLLQNHWANFNQTWNKAYLIEGNLGFFKWRAHPFPRGDNYEIVKIHWRNKKIFFSRNTEPISTKHGSKHPWVEGIQVCSNEGPRPFPRGDNYEIVKIHWWNLKKILFSRTTEPISNNLGTKHPWVKAIQVSSNEEPINSHEDSKVSFCS